MGEHDGASYGLILNLDVLDKMPAAEGRAAFRGMEFGAVMGELEMRPHATVRCQFSPEHLDSFLPELLLRVAESQNRELRTEESPIFVGYEQYVFGPCDPVPEWLEAKLDRIEREEADDA